MMRNAGSVALVAFAVTACMMPATARADCACVANGETFQQGETTCLRVDGRSWLARCGKVLNNSSWERLGEGCPLSRSGEEPENARPVAAVKPG